MNKNLNYIKYLANWISNYVTKSGCKGVTIGVSGGIDSAVVAAIVDKYTSIELTCVFMDINNSKLDKECIEQLNNFLTHKIRTINLVKPCKKLIKCLKVSDKMTIANIKPRVRMTTLYALASTNKSLVLGTSNADELYLGYFTKFGDSGCDLMPIARLNKAQVYELANELNIPKIIIDRAPSASLFEDQSDEQEMGVTYQEIDQYLSNKKISPKSTKIINTLHCNNLHKLSLPIKPEKELK